MHIVVFGATGYLGTRLVPQLLSAGHKVRVLARQPAKLDDVPWRDQVEVLEGDVTERDSVQHALDGQQVLYYLVHSLLRPDFADFDKRAASTVAEAAADAGVARIVYVGGIISDGQELSEHLASRAQVGRMFRESGVPTVELRAAIIIGSGSASFEMLRYLTERLPLMITPRWLRTQVQPIGVGNVLYYLVHSAELPDTVNRAFDIGGPDRFTYMEMIRKYAAVAGLQRRIAIPVPVLTPWLSAQWVNLITPIPRRLAVSLMESLENDVVCSESDITQHIPEPPGGLTHYEEAVALALARVREPELRTRWAHNDVDSAPSQPLPTDPDWSGGFLYDDVRQHRVAADPTLLWRAIETMVAEKRRWSVSPLAWPIQGWIRGLSRLLGMRRQPNTDVQVHTGEALDWWRVERVDRPQLLRLRADVPLPGRLWLEMSARPDGNGGAVYWQRALFQPYGLGGQLFWASSAAVRETVFSGIARDITTACKD